MLKGYSFWQSSPPTSTWLSDFGAGTRITGKSIVLDMNDTYGPDRLHFYFGDGTSSSGYDNIYHFYRVKFLPGLFISPTQRSQGYYWGYFKWGELCQGFVGATNWGDATDRTKVIQGVKACQNDHVLHNYGPNFTLLTFAYYGALTNVFNSSPAIGTIRSCDTPLLNGSTDTTGIQMSGMVGPNDYLRDNDRPEGNGTFDFYNYENRWLGIEAHASLGPDSGDANHSRYGDLEYWVYDETGNVLNHWKVLSDGVITSYVSNLAGQRIPSQTFYPNQKYNKVTIGGNIQLINGSGQQIGGNTSGKTYVDDVIVHGSRIGPTYYLLLNGTADATVPAAPRGLSIK